MTSDFRSSNPSKHYVVVTCMVKLARIARQITTSIIIWNILPPLPDEMRVRQHVELTMPMKSLMPPFLLVWLVWSWREEIFLKNSTMRVCRVYVLKIRTLIPPSLSTIRSSFQIRFCFILWLRGWKVKRQGTLVFLLLISFGAIKNKRCYFTLKDAKSFLWQASLIS